MRSNVPAARLAAGLAPYLPPAVIQEPMPAALSNTLLTNSALLRVVSFVVRSRYTRSASSPLFSACASSTRQLSTQSLTGCQQAVLAVPKEWGVVAFTGSDDGDPGRDIRRQLSEILGPAERGTDRLKADRRRLEGSDELFVPQEWDKFCFYVGRTQQLPEVKQ
jgi:hypothetical protein